MSDVRCPGSALFGTVQLSLSHCTRTPRTLSLLFVAPCITENGDPRPARPKVFARNSNNFVALLAYGMALGVFIHHICISLSLRRLISFNPIFSPLFHLQKDLAYRKEVLVYPSVSDGCLKLLRSQECLSAYFLLLL